MAHGVFADAWSAPGFMKTNDSAIDGGTLCGVPGANCKSGDWRQAYANYLVQYAKDYAAAGVPLSYVGPENETTIAPAQDSMIMSPAQIANFMAVLGAGTRAVRAFDARGVLRQHRLELRAAVRCRD